MALSDREQKMLDEIESALAEDTDFARSVANVHAPKKSLKVSRAIWPWIAIVVGIILLAVGFAVKIGGFPVLSLLGFIVMFAGGVLLLKSGDAPQGSRRKITVSTSRDTRGERKKLRETIEGHNPKQGGLSAKFYERFNNRD